MGKLRILSGRDICKILVKHGFSEIRQRGSHIVMQKQISEGTTTVPIPDHKEIRISEHCNQLFVNQAYQEVNLKLNIKAHNKASSGLLLPALRAVGISR